MKFKIYLLLNDLSSFITSKAKVLSYRLIYCLSDLSPHFPLGEEALSGDPIIAMIDGVVKTAKPSIMRLLSAGVATAFLTSGRVLIWERGKIISTPEIHISMKKSERKGTLYIMYSAR